jgi:hypothetical protein
MFFYCLLIRYYSRKKYFTFGFRVKLVLHLGFAVISGVGTAESYCTLQPLHTHTNVAMSDSEVPAAAAVEKIAAAAVEERTVEAAEERTAADDHHPAADGRDPAADNREPSAGDRDPAAAAVFLVDHDPARDDDSNQTADERRAAAAERLRQMEVKFNCELNNL